MTKTRRDGSLKNASSLAAAAASTQRTPPPDDVNHVVTVATETKTATFSSTNSSNSSAMDTRNMTWRQSNVGSKLLSKMGWSEGQALGKRQRRLRHPPPQEEEKAAVAGAVIEVDTSKYSSPTDSPTTPYCNGEGLRMVKRPDQLGLGATAASSIYARTTNAIQHVSDYVQILESLQPISTTTTSRHRTTMKPTKKKKKRLLDGSTKIRPPKQQQQQQQHNETGSVLSSSVLLPPPTATATTATTTSTNDTSHHHHWPKSNIRTHAKIRQSKFQTKSSEDYKCIFGHTNL
jgi:G-patch domain